MGSKGSQPRAPEPVDPGQSMGEYLFGTGFDQYQGITDPRLQSRLLSAESNYRPQYRALDLRDISSLVYGTETGSVRNPAYDQAKDRILDLESQLAKTPERIPQIKSVRGGRGKKEFYVPNPDYDRLKSEIDNQKAGLDRISPTTPTDGSPGLFQILEDSSDRAFDLQQRQLQQQRASDVAALQYYSPQVVSAYRAADPHSVDIINQLGNTIDRSSDRADKAIEYADEFKSEIGALDSIINDAEDRANRFSMESEGELSLERKRLADQAARSSSLSRGRLNDTSSIASEILNREGFKSQLRDEASRLRDEASRRRLEQSGLRQQYLQGQNIASNRINELGRLQGLGFNMNRSLAGDIGSVLLGRPSSSIQLGGQVLGQAQGQFNQGVGPQLFDPNVGVNMALGQQANLSNYSGALAQANASRNAGLMGALGSLGSAGISLFG